MGEYEKMNEILAENQPSGHRRFRSSLHGPGGERTSPTPLGARGGSWLHISSMELAAFSILGEEK